MNIHYDYTDLLSAVWKVTLRLTCLSWPGRRGGRILIAHICMISRSLSVADSLIDEDEKYVTLV